MDAVTLRAVSGRVQFLRDIANGACPADPLAAELHDAVEAIRATLRLYPCPSPPRFITTPEHLDYGRAVVRAVRADLSPYYYWSADVRRVDAVLRDLEVQLEATSGRRAA